MMKISQYLAEKKDLQEKLERKDQGIAAQETRQQELQSTIQEKESKIKELDDRIIALQKSNKLDSGW
jgi:hypothetical protein